MIASETLTEDSLLNGKVRLLQPRDGYRAAIDPVLLAAALGARPGERVLDLGCGVGAAALCLLARCPDVEVDGLEVQETLAELARRNAVLNAVEGCFGIHLGDAAKPPAGLGGYHHVMTNPPFFERGSGTSAANESRAMAHEEKGLDLAGWLKAAVKLLRPKGRLTLIHRAERLGDILVGLRGRGVGDVVVVPLWPRADRAAGRVIVSARKGVRSPLRLLPGLVLHGEGGEFTPQANAILRGAGALDPLGCAEDKS
ncbi:tRNA1(Val) (adenine(37)-N6)-methyltransferase [Paramagnetospirillum magneticum]|uniref:Predicted O-methyltransferase n=1 Tax=Paramagnetospirillum magneticum (strain ATCC 700264 / AMB-1) TaxID=342108 RepID=Q2W5A8_PARM1|nr:methyltransferase [Paramagnetospirillum magneticum]BAE50967.1 Predicted O-methyltransferase [Paramagnetospirillum magneticum AMB-1]